MSANAYLVFLPLKKNIANMQLNLEVIGSTKNAKEIKKLTIKY